MRKRLLTAMLVCGMAVAQSFDKPLNKQVVDLGPSPYYGSPYQESEPENVPHITLSCYYYQSFVVKQLDDKQKGAAWLAIAPTDHKAVVKCDEVHGLGEMVIDANEWSCYFIGVKGNLVFFDAADGVNGTMPFAIYESKT